MAPRIRDLPIRRGSLVALALVLTLALSGLVALGVAAQRRLDGLQQGNSEPVPWALAHLEVELMGLALKAGNPNADPETLDVDEVHSRIHTVQTSPLFADLHTLPAFGEPLQRMSAALENATMDIPALLDDARLMSLAGQEFLASQSDLQRGAAADALRGQVLLLAGLFAALSALLILFVRIYGISRRRSDALRLTSTRLSTIVDTSADAIVVATRSGRVLEFNPAAEAMFGYSRADALQMQTPDFFPAPCPVTGKRQTEGILLLPDTPADAPPGRIEAEARRLGGAAFPVEVSMANADSADGGIVVGFLRDISDRKQAERDLTEARDRALAGEQAKARFLAVMSHEMRTPLNGLLGSAEILQSTALTPDQARLVGVIATSAQVLLDHVNAGLDIARIEAGAMSTEMTAFSMAALVDEVVANQSGLAAAVGNRIKVVMLGVSQGQVLGSSGQVRQILLNLVGNAVKFTANGQITIEIDTQPIRDGSVEICLRVIDSGVGIAEDDLGRVFDDYVTLQASYDRMTGGTGLGLGITRRLVQVLGGEIGVESIPGQGSLFWVRLPFATAVETGGAAAKAPLSILVVDDNQINRFVLRSLLEETGNLVTEASDGQSGVDMAAGTLFDLILMDVSMPGMDGIEAARHIRTAAGASRGARIAAVTAHAHAQDRRRLAEAGMPDCLIKPITRGALATLLAGRQVSGSAAPGAPPLVDAGMLADLTGRLAPYRVTDLLARFINEGDATVFQLQNGPSNAEAATLIHRMAGVAATFGAAELAQYLCDTQEAAAAGPLPADRLQALTDLWSRTRAALLPQVQAAE